MGVDAYLYSGSEDDLLDQNLFNLNISHKTNFDEAIRRESKGIIIFSPSNCTQKSKFEDYSNYFKKRKIAGIVNHFKDQILYILPPCKQARELAPEMNDDNLLGLFVDISKSKEIVGIESQEGEPEQEEEIIDDDDSQESGDDDDENENEMMDQEATQNQAQDPPMEDQLETAEEYFQGLGQQ